MLKGVLAEDFVEVGNDSHVALDKAGYLKVLRNANEMRQNLAVPQYKTTSTLTSGDVNVRFEEGRAILLGQMILTVRAAGARSCADCSNASIALPFSAVFEKHRAGWQMTILQDAGGLGESVNASRR